MTQRVIKRTKSQSDFMHHVTMHNAFGGMAAHIEGAARRILTGDSLTIEARTHAEQILISSIALRKALEERVDLK